MPGIEFDAVTTELVRGASAPAAERATSAGDDFVGGVRVADIREVRGEIELRVTLRLGREAVTSRPVAVTVTGRTAVTLSLSRDCREVMCPVPGGDEAAVACIGGRCADPGCTAETPDRCPDPECRVNADCTSDVECAQPRCLEGVCLIAAANAGCPPMQYCDPDVGCRPVPSERRCGPAAAVVPVAGFGGSCGIDDGGAMSCWGDNDSGRLGVGFEQDTVEVPTRVAGSAVWRAATLGFDHGCGVDVNGALHCWGDDFWGQLGLGPEDLSTVAPVRVGGRSDWQIVVAGDDNTCGVTADGSLFCWGDNAGYELGLGEDVSEAPIPTRVDAPTRFLPVLDLAADHACAVDDTEALRCWGDNTSYQLGLGEGVDAAPLPRPVSAEPHLSVATGDAFTCAIRRPGTLHCWGDNTDGQLGHDSFDVVESALPIRVGEASDWEWVGAGAAFACGRRAGTLYCWGDNTYDQIGVAGVGVSAESPVPVLGDVSFASVGSEHACATDTSGGLLCWGSNASDQIGVDVGGAIERPTPVCLGPL